MDEEQKRQLNDEMNSIIKGRKQFIEQNYPVVRRAYQEEYDWPEMDALRYEISLALIFGLAQASITLTNHFMESLLKNSLIIFDATEASSNNLAHKRPRVDSVVRFLAPSRKKYNSQDLSNNINRICRIGLITKDEKEKLHEFREKFRNAYSHSDKEKTFRDSRIETRAMSVGNDEFILGEPEKTRVAELMIIQGLAQVYQAQEEAVPYFLYMDGLTRRIREKLFPKPNNCQ